MENGDEIDVLVEQVGGYWLLRFVMFLIFDIKEYFFLSLFDEDKYLVINYLCLEKEKNIDRIWKTIKK